MAERSEVELEIRLTKQNLFESPESFVEQTSVTDRGIYGQFEEYSDTDSDDLGNTSTLRNPDIVHKSKAKVCGGAD